MGKNTLTTKEAAELLSVTQRTIQLWSDSGILAVGKTPGGHRRIQAESVQKLLESMKGEDTSFDSEESLPEERVNVLLVEDDLALQKMMGITLSRWQLPINVIMVDDGYEALIAMGHHKPKVLITDLNMPRIDGFHMLKIISESELLDNTGICVVTGLDEAQVKEGGGLDSDIEVLGKPVNFELLKRFVEKTLKQSVKL